MKLEQEHIDKIRTSFENMQTKEDLLYLLNDVKPLIYGEKTVPFELKQITWYSNPKIAGKRYTEFEIKKKSGSKRNIHAPVKGLKAIQKTLSVILQCVYKPHQAAMGFVRDRSIVDNAKIHAGNRYVYNIDLKDFFPSIDQARVWKTLQLKPFNLNKETTVEQEFMKWEDFKKEYMNTEEPITFGRKNGRFFTNTPYGNIYMAKNFDIQKDTFLLKGSSSLKSKSGQSLKGTLWAVNKIPDTSRRNIANIIASLCCTELEVERKTRDGEWEKVKRNVLPQGAPTSPVVSNIVCQRLDFLLTGVAKRFGLKYSRYADDITFSSLHNVYQPDSEFLTELHRIISEQNFHIKESKTRLQKDGFRQEVTGLLVNEKVNVRQRYIKQLRMWLYYWEIYGYEKASGFFLQQYIADKGHVKNGNPNMEIIISGKLDYLKMVKGRENELYLKLKTRFDNLTGKNDSNNLMQDEPFFPGGSKNQMMINLTSEPQEVLKKQISKLSESVTTVNETIPILHNPRELTRLLNKFTENDSALKYATHSWDAGRDANLFSDLAEFLLIAKEQYRVFSYTLKNLSENLNGKIYNFLFNKDIAKSGWGDKNPQKRIYFGWSSPELLEACNKDLSLNPEDFILPEKYHVQRGGKTLQKFKHIIDVFKNEIEIKDDNSVLLNLILQKHDTYLTSFSDPIITNLENKTFYTDVQWFSKTLDLIFQGIQKYPQHPKVEYYVEDCADGKMRLNILHLNSFKPGLSIYDDKLTIKRGDLGTIKNQLKNLCDWSIESQFSEGNYRINYLTSEEATPAYEPIETSLGFKHILTFYK